LGTLEELRATTDSQKNSIRESVGRKAKRNRRLKVSEDKSFGDESVDIRLVGGVNLNPLFFVISDITDDGPEPMVAATDESSP